MSVRIKFRTVDLDKEPWHQYRTLFNQRTTINNQLMDLCEKLGPEFAMWKGGGWSPEMVFAKNKDFTYFVLAWDAKYPYMEYDVLEQTDD